MLRKLGFCVLITTLVLVACGRQVTPDRTGPQVGVLPGRMLIRFDTASPMDFQNYRYLVVFNTSGNGGVPYSNGFNTGYANYSFIFAVSGNSGQVLAQLYQIVQQPGGASGQPSQVLLQTSPIQVQFNPNSNGLGTEFTINFDRTLMFGIGTPSPGPTSSPLSIWYFNFFTTDGRVANSSRYNAESGFGQAYLANSFQASFNVQGDAIDGLVIPAADKNAAEQILNAYKNLYVRNGRLLDPIPNLGEDNFTAEDKYLGRTVAFRIDRFLIAFNGYSDRQKLVDLAAATDARILGSIRKQLVTADKTAASGPDSKSKTPPWQQH